MAKKQRSGPTPIPTPAPRARRMRAASHGEIAARAYELFVERGGVHGSDIEDWLIAERELAGADRRLPGRTLQFGT